MPIARVLARTWTPHPDTTILALPGVLRESSGCLVFGICLPGLPLISHRIFPVLLVACFVHLWNGGPDLQGQASPEALSALPIGTRVRVIAPGAFEGSRVGAVLRVEADTLSIVGASGARASVPLATITGLELSAGRTRDRGRTRGMAVGAVLAGAAVGAMVWTGTEVCLGYETCLTSDPAGAAGGFLVGAIPGALIGAIIGLPGRREEWRALPLDGVRGVSLTPNRIGVTLAVP